MEEVRVAARNTGFALVKTENGKSKKCTLSEEQRVIMRLLALLRHEEKFKNPSLPATKKHETKHYWHIVPPWIIYKRNWGKEKPSLCISPIIPFRNIYEANRLFFTSLISHQRETQVNLKIFII